MSTTARPERFQLRATTRQASIIRAAAQISKRNTTEFLLDAGTSEALRTLADQRLFLVDERVYDEFVANVGSFLLGDTLRRIAAAAGIVGSRAALVHAKDEETVGFYQRFGFVSTEASKYHLEMPLKDVRRQLGL